MSISEEFIIQSEKFLVDSETLGECSSNNAHGEKVDSKDCVHHWLIDLPSGSKSSGTCKICGEYRKNYFVNSMDNMSWSGTPKKFVPRNKKREDKEKRTGVNDKDKRLGRPKDGYINKISDKDLI